MPINKDDIDQELDLENDIDLPAKPAKKARPQVEGINAPRVSRETVKVRPTFKAAEEFKPSSHRLMPERVSTRSGRKSGFDKAWWIILIVLILLAAGDWAFGSRLPRVLNFFRRGTVAPTSATGQQAYVPPVEPASPATSTPTTSTPASLVPATTTPATSTSVALPAAAGKQLKINNTGSGYLNVRSQPSTAGALITKVHPGETYAYIDHQYDWYKIVLPGGQAGWVAGQYVTVLK
jgi:hypothetical protein